jgi:hypothetical protein
MEKRERKELDNWVEHWAEQGIHGDVQRGYIGEWAQEMLKDEKADYGSYHLNTFLDVLKARVKKDVEDQVEILREQVKDGLG